MKREIITITDSGTVTVPGEVRMTVAEIADLFGIFYQTAKCAVRAIEKAGVADGDYSMCCVAAGQKVHPEYYGLETVVAVAFRINSQKAGMFRKWLIRKAVRNCYQQTIVFQINSRQILN